MSSLKNICFIPIIRTSKRSLVTASSDMKSKYDAVIIGGGHNGLVTAAYFQRYGLNVAVFEKRSIIGGAAVTEEIVPGFKFSRASYVLSLLRPTIYYDLELKKHGLKVHLRNPSSYTPILPEYQTPGGPTSLLLSNSHQNNMKEITKFSKQDAQRYGEFEDFLNRCVSAIDPLLDSPPPDIRDFVGKSLWHKYKFIRNQLQPLLTAGKNLGKDIPGFYQLMTAPINKILNTWFESEPLKATLATDGLIGTILGPNSPGTGYVLLHHVMGELEGVRGAWGYPEGGMGSVSNAIARAARAFGAHIFVNRGVSKVLVDNNGGAAGISLDCGKHIRSKLVFSNATSRVTFADLCPSGSIPQDYMSAVKNFNYDSAVTKINVALKRLPNFLANPNLQGNVPMPHHQCTIHLNCEHTSMLEEAFQDAQQGKNSKRPMIELVIPSSLDPTLAPEGCHVGLIFTQYTPYKLSQESWNQETKLAHAKNVFNSIEKYCPGFKDSIIDSDILSPVDLEKIFSLTGGNIFHGSLSLDQLFTSRPYWSPPPPRTPLSGLYLCGSGGHPGGGVMGAPGRIAALQAVEDFKL